MEYKLLAKLFNSSELKRIISGDLSTFELIRKNFSEFQDLVTISDYYDEAYRLLLKHYRNEYIVKNEITNKILLGTHSMKTTTMLSELRTGRNIADCLVLNNYSTCYEIKTEMDSLIRFREQLSSYVKAYDKTYVVTHKSHLKHVLSLHSNSPTFGIIELTKRNTLKTIINAPINYDFDLDMTFDTLRKPEYMYIAEKVNGAIPAMPNTQIYSYCKKYYKSLSPIEANYWFKKSLKKFRVNDRKFINSLSKPLKNVGISYQLNRQEKTNLLCCLMNNIDISSGGYNVLSLLERQTS